MEFFGEVNSTGLDKSSLRNLLTIERLSELCASIYTVTPGTENNGTMFCVWGEYEVNREQLSCGVRFSLPRCPNALAWTITTDQSSEKTIIHCTIDKKQHDQDFIESIHDFVNDWSAGISKALVAG